MDLSAGARHTPRSRARLEVHPLHWREREAVLRFLRRAPRENLALIDLVDRLGAGPTPGEARPELLGAWRDRNVCAVASLRPSLCLATDTPREAIEALRPYVQTLGSGLIKSEIGTASGVWEILAGEGRRAIVDRVETALFLQAKRAARWKPRAGISIRPAAVRDLDDLVFAARASLREEGRPDPFEGDPPGFVRWVRGRVRNALVATVEDRVAFVGYADVRRPDGCLVQGVYTWPGFRRRGLATAGVVALCARAFAEGSDHAQLAVVDGNLPGERLYERLAFEPFAKLRTILFS